MTVNAVPTRLPDVQVGDTVIHHTHEDRVWRRTVTAVDEARPGRWVVRYNSASTYGSTIGDADTTILIEQNGGDPR